VSEPYLGVACADVVPEPVRWLWEPYLARGKLAVLDGDPGTGKSLVVVDLAARLSRGGTMPNGPVRFGARETVLLLNAEDDARDTIRPRVLAAGGDPKRVRVFAAPGIGMNRPPQFPQDYAQLEAAVRETRPALVVIDPLPAFFPADQFALSRALLPFADLADETGTCVLLVRHLRKAGGANPLYRGLGGIGIVGMARTALALSRHPDDPELRVLAPTKTNIGPPGATLGFRLAPSEHGPATVEWVRQLELTADDLFAPAASAGASARARDRAAAWLLQLLSTGPVRASAVAAAACAAGIPTRTLTRAKQLTGVSSSAVRTGDAVEWWWQAPPTAPTVAPTTSAPAEPQPAPPRTPTERRQARLAAREARAAAPAEPLVTADAPMG
jgi:hypothetical protein